MPKRKRTYKRKTWRKRKRFRKKRSYRTPLPGSLGKTMAKKFRYCDQFSLDPAVGVIAVRSYRLNGMYDPDATVGQGHQPIGYDQIMTWYNHYFVSGAKITCTFTSASTSGTTGTAICGIEISNSATPTPVANTLMEGGKAVYKTLTTQYANGKVVVSRKVSIKKMAGVKNLLDNQDYRGAVALDPVEIIYAHVFCLGIDTAADTTAVKVQLMLNQFAIMVEPIPLAGS